MARKKILIAGAGLGGLTAALALIREGFEVLVLEQASRLGEVGAGLQLAPNSTRVLESLGLASALRAVASRPEGKEVRLWSTGQTWKLFDLGEHSASQYGFPYYTLYRPDLHRLLVEAVLEASPGSILLGAKCVSHEVSDDGVTVHLDDGRQVEGSILVGADGVHSRVRQQLIGDGRAQFSGCLAWRGVIPAEQLSERLRRPVGANWIGPGGHVIHYPLRRNELVNFVGIVERDDWKVESWTTAGSVEECLRDFQGWNEDVLALIKAIEQPYKWALMQREPLQQWSFGRVTLLGDAAHPTLPFLAQGAGMAIEDGMVLMRCLKESRHDPVAALGRYQHARIDRTSRIVRGSSEAAKRFHNPALASSEGAVAYVDREWNEERTRERYHWLFDYQAEAVPLPV